MSRPGYPLFIALTLAVVLASGGCSGWKPYQPPVAGETPEGPGLFSGEDGEFVIHRKEVSPPPEEKEKKTSSGEKK